jgi:transcription initiation factor TFIIB
MAKLETYNDLVETIELDCNALKLHDKIKDEAVSILNKFMKKGSLQGRSLDNYAAALIWLACKKWNHPLTAKAINDVLDLDSMTTKGVLLISRSGNYIARIAEEHFHPVGLTKYVEMIQAQMHSPAEAMATAFRLINYLETNNIVVGYNNPALASAIAYISDRCEGHRCIEKDYCQVVGTTEISLRSYKRKLLKAIPNLVQYGTRYKWKEFLVT